MGRFMQRHFQQSLRYLRFSLIVTTVCIVVWNVIPYANAANDEIKLHDSTLLSAPNRKPPAKKLNETRKETLSWKQLQQLFPENYYLHGPRDKRQVALSFDDAPDHRFTPQVLDILATYHIKATFFVVGERAKQNPALVKRMVDEGHVVGNHSYNHALFTKLNVAQYKEQILDTNRIIHSIVGYEPRFIRPPYGEISKQQLQWSADEDYIIVNWDVDSEDWKNNPSSEQVMININRTLKPGSIILQHAGGGSGQSLMGTIEALPELIEFLQKENYEIVLISDLIDKSPIR